MLKYKLFNWKIEGSLPSGNSTFRFLFVVNLNIPSNLMLFVVYETRSKWRNAYIHLGPGCLLKLSATSFAVFPLLLLYPQGVHSSIRRNVAFQFCYLHDTLFTFVMLLTHQSDFFVSDNYMFNNRLSVDLWTFPILSVFMFVMSRFENHTWQPATSNIRIE